jgi:predicted transcriptional regulator
MPMLASSIALKGIPMLHLEDKVSFALQCMEDFDLQHLAVVKEDYFIGMISKSDLLDNDESNCLDQLSNQFIRIGVNNTAHFLTALDLFTKNQLTLLPVLNEQQECTGFITQQNLNDCLAQFLDSIDMYIKSPDSNNSQQNSPYSPSSFNDYSFDATSSPNNSDILHRDQPIRANNIEIKRHFSRYNKSRNKEIS